MASVVSIALFKQDIWKGDKMGKDRLGAFMDAVIAIVMTILVLELEKPAEPTLQAFWNLRIDFAV